MIKSKVILLIIFIVYTSSCFREEIISKDILDNYKSKPVVYCFISEGDSIYAQIYKTFSFYSPAFNQKDTYELNSDVWIKDDKGDSIQLLQINDSLPIYGASQNNFTWVFALNILIFPVFSHFQVFNLSKLVHEVSLV